MGYLKADPNGRAIELRAFSASKVEAELPSTIRYDGSEFNFYRVDNNFGYVRGNVSFSEDCNNNVVVSDLENTILKETSDCFVLISEGEVSVSPLQEVETCDFLKDLPLGGKQIRYHRPERIAMKEGLRRKEPIEIATKLTEIYGIKSVQIKEIEARGTRNGVFYIKDDSGQEYILKYVGKDSEKTRLLREITQELPDIFPQIKTTLDGDVAFEMGDGFYGLESFLRGNVVPKRDRSYFLALGREMALMHLALSSVAEKKSQLKKAFVSKAKHLSESNLVALEIDLKLANVPGITDIIGELRKRGISERVDALKDNFIHGDLNFSNIIWNDGKPKYVDLESLKVSKRILDFGPPLIFGGNMEQPQYIEGSLDSLIDGYEQTAQDRLSREEFLLTVPLVKYILINNFVVRRIRRGELENRLDDLLKNLSII